MNTKVSLIPADKSINRKEVTMEILQSFGIGLVLVGGFVCLYSYMHGMEKLCDKLERKFDERSKGSRSSDSEVQ